MLDVLYAQAAAARRRWYERHPEWQRRLKQPVISVGNLSVGGTGKTPLVATLVRELVRRGERPAVLSRGYGRRTRDVGVVVVSDGHRVLANLDAAGDEPLMLAATVPGVVVAVCEDRYLAGVVAERRLGATVHVLDDGFQHLRLARDLDILVTFPGEITNGRALPFGRLREPNSAAARAHLVVVMGADTAEARSEAWALGIGEFVAARRALALDDGEQSQEESWRVTPVFAVAGIGDPEQFFAALAQSGLDLRGSKTFADHHRYTAADVAAIAAAARTSGADLVVTTEKDAVRLAPLAPLPFRLVPIPLTIALDPPETLFACVDAALVRARTSR